MSTKTITYENLTEEQKRDPKILPFDYKKPFSEEIDKYLKEREQNEPHIRGHKGIMSQVVSKMTRAEQRAFMGGYLVPKGFSEREIMRMPFKALEELFNKVMEL
jgi:hypothetical protein|tara:strand:+ start:1168 stop:1479 length:312 start_codon:yes stop_codon:yes gene_type:complete